MKIVIRIALVLLLIVGVVVLLRQSKQTSIREPGITQEAASESAPADVLESKESLIPYSSEALDEAISNRKRPILFFHAAWCPYCRAAESDIREHSDVLPSNITIMKIDYDTSRELRAQYGVIAQDTFVLLDPNKNEIIKWQSGGEGVKTILENVEKFQ